ncbi:hypothetical protein RUM44_010960 [Polyplax serrata]|uniref:Rho GTPase-activating protein 17 n=1 Tax=Polyplax serrata TaxID=468196 RepID=A0ABR1ANP1_POLSC
MKKQFFRVKQLADQTFSRAGKTDVLSDDLQEADRKVEYIKNSCQNVGKKLSGCLLLGQLQGESGTKEKLMKKSPNYQLGAAMMESGSLCDDDSLMKTVLNKCGHAEKSISEESMEHDHRVEQHVIAPLQSVLDTEIPNIIKLKRNVTKVCLDMDSAKTRYQQAQKHSSNNLAGAAKIESIKDELKDSEQKVEQSRDVLASEMFHLASRESELCYTILQYYKFQKRYHEYTLGILDKLIPELETEICSSKIKPVYGVDLEEHLQVTGRKIAFPVELCVCALLELGMEEEGLFRLTGAASKVKRMKLSFDAGCMNLATALAYRDPHVIAGALKSYLRELPEPLLTHSLYDEWLNAAKAQTHPDNKLQALWTVVHKLPKANFDNLNYLIKFFHMLSKNHEVNRMSPHNIAIVIAPSLIWTKEENGGSGFGLNVNVSLYPSIIDLLVTYADWFFDKDMEFYITLEPIMNGEVDEKSVDKGGIDNKGFDIKVADKMNKSVIEKGSGQNHPGGDVETNLSEMKRSQSIGSLSEEVHTYESPRPITRRKNKSVAPGPPIFKDEKKKDDAKLSSKSSSQPGKGREQNLASDKPDKPPRPSVTSNATLPRPSKSFREKSTELNREEFKVSTGEESLIRNLAAAKKEPVTKTTASTNTDTYLVSKENRTSFAGSVELRGERPVAAPRTVSTLIEVSDKPKPESESKPIEYNKVNLISVKKEWLLGKDSVENENAFQKKPVVPERPSTLKTQSFKFNRNSIGASLRNNYENITLSSTENLSGNNSEDRSMQKAQISSTDKQQVSVVEIRNKEKRDSFEDVTKNGGEGVTNNEPGSKIEESCDDDDDRDVVVPSEERKTASSNSNRPLSLPGTEKPERPPKPDYKISSSSSSHTRTFSDGQIIEIKPAVDAHLSHNSHNFNNNNNNNNNNGSTHCIKHVINNNLSSDSNQASMSSSPPQHHHPQQHQQAASMSSTVIKHPQTSPPPPPVPAKPRANSQGESTDF